MSRITTLLTAGLVLFAAISARAAEGGKGYDGFRLMQTRNIFDPNRKAAPPTNTQRQTERPRGPRASSLTLTGTMVTEDRALAFFGGSRADFSKVAKVGESVGDFKILAITAADVDLERAGKRITLAVGRQQQVEGVAGAEPEEEPAPATDPAADPATSNSSNPTKPAAASAASAAAPAAPSTSGGSDVLRKMMERRQKEMSK